MEGYCDTRVTEGKGRGPKEGISTRGADLTEYVEMETVFVFIFSTMVF